MRLYIIVTLLALISGCVGIAKESPPGPASTEIVNIKEGLDSQSEPVVESSDDTVSRNNQPLNESATVTEQDLSSPTTNGLNDQVDENGLTITPGMCFVQATIKPRPIVDKTEIIVKDSMDKISVSPAEIGKGTQQIVTKEGAKTYDVVPPKYQQVSERVLIQPEMKKFEVIPAVYTEKAVDIVIDDAKTVLEPCVTAGTNYSKGSGAQAYCAKEIPAKIQTIKTQALVKPETTKEIIVPAQYKIVKRWVVAEPAQVIEVSNQPEITELPLVTIKHPEQTNSSKIPAVTQVVPQINYEGQANIVTRRAICDADINPLLISRIQQRLKALGYSPGPDDGKLGEKTVSALSVYQANNGLAIGAVTYESLENLFGVTLR